jgi:DNA-binding transcriptional ArsR family regulator
MIHNEFVMKDAQLDRVFGALAHATRRGMLARLSGGERNITALAADYAISQPAVSRHVRVLERAGLVRSVRRGREHYIRVNPDAAGEAQAWIAYYTRFWRRHFAAVQDLLDKRKEQRHEP